MKTLKDFPHILKEIQLRWGTPPWLEKYLAKIMMMDRGEGWCSW